MNKLPPSAISLFCGAGGCDIGLEEAGFHVATSTDFDQTCIETLSHNQQRKIPIRDGDGCYLANTNLLCAPISELTAKDVWESDGRPDLLVGGPPCQPFSSAGTQRSVDDERGRLFEDFVRLADELDPGFVLFENVRGLVTARGPSGEPGEAISLVRETFESAGFRTSFAVLNAADFGLPQRRVRLFMFGTRRHALPDFPKQTHAKDGHLDLFRHLRPWSTLGNVLAHAPTVPDDEVIRPSEALAEELNKLEPGSGLKSRGAQEPTRPGGHWGYKQGTFIADPQLPARTVTASSSQDWIKDPKHGLRRLTTSEVAALQGFPSDWQFSGTRARQYRQIGNAVPPPIARLLGKAVIDARLRCNAAEASDPFPEYMKAAIKYTKKEDLRNGRVRVRSPHFVGRQ